MMMMMEFVSDDEPTVSVFVYIQLGRCWDYKERKSISMTLIVPPVAGAERELYEVKNFFQLSVPR